MMEIGKDSNHICGSDSTVGMSTMVCLHKV